MARVEQVFEVEVLVGQDVVFDEGSSGQRFSPRADGLAFRRWAEGGTVYFGVSGIASGLAGAASSVLAGYHQVGAEWRRGFPADAPHLEEAWGTFAARVGTMLRQAARLEPVPWRDALRELCRRTAGGPPVSWWLTGSAALAVRGARIEPADLDVVCGAADASIVGDLFADVLVEPVLTEDAEGISEWRGRAFCGALIEWIGGVRACVDEPRLTDFGPVAAARLEMVIFEDWQIRVPPLDVQRAVSVYRGRLDRVAEIDVLAAKAG
jgi:hypothetical protein